MKTLISFNRRACGLLIAGVFVLLVIVLAIRTPKPSDEIVSLKVVPYSSVRVVALPPVVFDSQSYYRIIIDNNLFHPLEWTPPRPKEPYRLLGTLLSRDANTPPKAILQTTAGQRTYIVTTGEKIDAETTVIEIKAKQVTLSTKGQQRTLTLKPLF